MLPFHSSKYPPIRDLKLTRQEEVAFLQENKTLVRASAKISCFIVEKLEIKV